MILLKVELIHKNSQEIKNEISQSAILVNWVSSLIAYMDYHQNATITN